MNSELSQHLVANLQLRARASCSSLPLLVDRAALLLANELGVDTNKQLSFDERAAIARSQWLDHCIIQCLKTSPQAIGIEFDAGINTRFHRVSAQLEWPTFRWADINTPDTSAFSQRLLPITDNYRQLGLKEEQNDWLYRAGWQPGSDLLLVTEHANERFWECVRQALAECGTAKVHVIFCAPTSEIQPQLKASLSQLELQQMRHFYPQTPFKALAYWLLGLLATLEGKSLRPWLGYHFTTA